MNKKVKLITGWLAATVFLFALAVNVKVTLNDPFVIMSDNAIAETTGTGTTGTGTTETDTDTSSDSSQLKLAWSQKLCKNGSTYEICAYGGDGNTCTSLNARTRNCPYPGDL